MEHSGLLRHTTLYGTGTGSQNSQNIWNVSRNSNCFMKEIEQGIKNWKTGRNVSEREKFVIHVHVQCNADENFMCNFMSLFTHVQVPYIWCIRRNVVFCTGIKVIFTSLYCWRDSLVFASTRQLKTNILCPKIKFHIMSFRIESNTTPVSHI